jgi:hypothetical protein
LDGEWYEYVPAASPIDQGDILFSCPVSSWKAAPLVFDKTTDYVGNLKAAHEFSLLDLVTMTQTCDLAQNKVRFVVLCPHYGLEDYRKDWASDMKARGQNPTDKIWSKYLESICKGHIWNLAILNSENTDQYSAEHRIVDFHEVLSLPREFIESWIKQEGEMRLRLRPPYREHLAQAFARFFMRVGLPTDIARPWPQV